MYLSPQTKVSKSTPTNHSYRGFRVSPSNRMNISPIEPCHNDPDFYSHRMSPQHYDPHENPHFTQRDHKAQGYYRTKRPADMTEAMEHDGFYNLNRSNASPHESSFYNSHYDNSREFLRPGLSCLSTRAVQNKEEDRLLDNYEARNVTYRGTPSNRREKADANYLAEKVYAMKLRPQGIMASLIPLARSKSPVHGSNNHVSSKNTTPVNSQTRLREAEDRYYAESMTRLGDTSLSDMSNRNRSLLQKGNGTSSQTSIGQMRNEKMGQDSQLKRVNSWGKLSKSPVRSPVNDRGYAIQQGMGNQSQRREKSIVMMRARVLAFEEKIQTTMWQVCQRNKRLVLVTLLENLHYYRMKVAQHFKKRAYRMKARCFYQWQNFLLGMNLERQRVAQEKQNNVAMKFYFKCLLKKSFNKLKDLMIPKPKTLQQTPTIHYNSAKDLHQTSYTSLKAVVNQNRPASRNSQTRSPTPQNNSTTKRIQQITNKAVSTKTEKRTASKERTPNAKRQVNITKTPIKGTCAPLSTRNSSAHQLAATKNDTSTSKAESIETPGFPKNQLPFPFPTFGKTPLYYYEPSEIQELTELSQTPQKDPMSYKNSGLDQSFGCENLDQSEDTPKGPTFDSILSEILQGSESHIDRENMLALTLQNKTKEIEKKMMEKVIVKGDKDVKRNYCMGKQNSPAKTARNRSSPSKTKQDVKAYSGSLTPRARNEGVHDSPQFVKMCAVDKAKIALTRKTKASKGNKDAEEEVSLDLDKKMKFAESHYVNNLKIKAMSGMLENYVEAFKSRDFCRRHYERSLLKNAFTGWSESIVPKPKSEDEVSEDTYNEIVDRFRFIILTEKAIRHWRKYTQNNRRNLEKI